MIQITDRIYIGTTTEALDEGLMDGRHLKFGAILSCTTVIPPAVQALPNVLYGSIPIPDATPWPAKEKAHAVDFIRQAVKRGNVFVHSDLGRSRCAAAVYFYLVREKGLSESEALDLVKSLARPHRAIIGGVTPKVRVTTATPQAKPKCKQLPLSIVVVTWNRLECVKKCIGSIMERTTGTYGLIVVDNGSDEEMLEYLRAVRGITLLELGRNFGKGAAANLGFRKATGAWICYLDGDIEVPDGWFEEVKTTYEKLKNPGWITLPYEDTALLEKDFREGLYQAPSVDGGMVFMSGKVHEELGGFVVDRLYGGVDTEYAARARSRKLRVGYVKSERRLIHHGKEDSPRYKEWKRLGVPVVLKPPVLPDTVNIVMVRYNLPTAEQECIESVLNCTQHPYRLTTADNYERKERLGVLWNELIGQSQFNLVCLLNSDCLVSAGWLERMAATFLLDDKIAVVGPSSNSCGTVQQIKPGLKVTEISAFSDDLAETYRGKWEEADISGFCYLLRKDVCEKVGGFSPEFALYGQERELNARLKKEGYITAWCKSSFVYHLGGASTKKAQQSGDVDLSLETDVRQRLREKGGV